MPAKERDPLLEASRIGAKLIREDAPLLPHERDESVDATAAPQPVMLQAQRDIARGLVNYSSAQTRQIARKPTAEIESILGFIEEPELIHRDNLVLL